MEEQEEEQLGEEISAVHGSLISAPSTRRYSSSLLFF